MAAPQVRISYPDCEQIAREFDDHADRAHRLTQTIQDQLDSLQNDKWVGDNADAFYREMNDNVLPGLARLNNALKDAYHGVHTLVTLFQAGDEEAAAIFNGAISDAPTGMGGKGDTLSPRAKLINTDFNQVPPLSGDLDGNGIIDSARERSAAYANWNESLREQWLTLSGGVRFYEAAARVTELLGSVEGNLFASFGIELLTFGHGGEAQTVLTQTGEELFALNRPVYEMLSSGALTTTDGFHLVSPYNPPEVFDYIQQGYTVNASGQLVSADGSVLPIPVRLANSPLAWDMDMVFREQSQVQAALNEMRPSVPTYNAITMMLNFDQTVAAPINDVLGIVPVDPAAVGAIHTAESWLGHDVNFANFQDRAAIGLAMVLQAHTVEPLSPLSVPSVTSADYQAAQALLREMRPLDVPVLTDLDH